MKRNYNLTLPQACFLFFLFLKGGVTVASGSAVQPFTARCCVVLCCVALGLFPVSRLRTEKEKACLKKKMKRSKGDYCT